MNQIRSNYKVSVICHIVFAIGVLPFVIFYPKTETLLSINGWHFPWLDQFMYHITRLPELALIIFVLVLSLFQERRVFLSVAVAMAICGLIILLFKHVLFTDFNRPIQWLSENAIDFNRVEGIRHHANNSFPSGHTMSAFCALGLSGLIAQNGFMQLFFFLLACASAYSRVYLAQHYLMDVYAGALLGYFIAFVFYILAERNFKTPFWTKAFINLKK